MQRDTYLFERLKAIIIPPYWQCTPYSGPVEFVHIPTGDGIALGAALLSRSRPDVLIICHGVCSNQRSLAVLWLAEALVGPWDVLTFNWRGYITSGGRASFGGDEAHDLCAVLKWARIQGYRRVGVIGDSMGGLISLATLGDMARRKPQEPDLQVIYPDRIATLAAPAEYRLTGWPRPFLMRFVAPFAWARPIASLLGFRLGPLKMGRPLDVVGHIDVPLLLTHGTNDGIVPVENVFHLQRRAPHARVRIYEGVEHGVDAMRLQIPQVLLNDLRAHFSAM